MAFLHFLEISKPTHMFCATSTRSLFASRYYPLTTVSYVDGKYSLFHFKACMKKPLVNRNLNFQIPGKIFELEKYTGFSVLTLSDPCVYKLYMKAIAVLKIL